MTVARSMIARATPPRAAMLPARVKSGAARRGRESDRGQAGDRSHHDQPDKEIARHLVEPFDAGGEHIAEDHLKKDCECHQGEDEAAEEPEPVVDAGAPAAERQVETLNLMCRIDQ